jgi:hypothetical protein
LDTGAVAAVFVEGDIHKFTNVMFTHKGIIWLLLATVAEVPPTVRLGIFFAPLIFAHRHSRTGVHFFESQWYVFIVVTSSMTHVVELNPG